MLIKIGTRGSKLALWQAEYVKAKIESLEIKAEIVVIETKGDKILDKSLSKIGSKGVFTEELEEQLLRGEIDIAVHSAKDLQSELPDSLEIIAYMEREKPTDVLISLSNDLTLKTTSDFTIGTSSTRRVALLKAQFPNLRIVNIRGNLQTRIRKMEEGNCDALLLAYAGVHRMGYDKLIVHEFNPENFVPPVGQGSVAIEITKSLDTHKKQIIRDLCNDINSEICLKCERAYLKELKGGCSVPVYGWATLHDSKLHFKAGVVNLDGSEKLIFDLIQNENESPEQLGIRMAQYVHNAGGKEILENIKQQLLSK
jgi:hydroxymethylbilane synthase